MNFRHQFWQKNIEKLIASPYQKQYIFWVMAALFLVYAPLIQNNFIEYDLSDFLMGYPYLELTWANLENVWFRDSHSMTHLTHMVLYYFVGENFFPHALFNLILHVCNVWLIFVFIKTLFLWRLSPKKAFWLALIAATTFAFHPAQVEAVAWLMARKDVLYVFFYLIGLKLYLKYLEKQHYVWYAFVFVAYYFSIESKVVAITFPLSLIVVDYYLFAKNLKLPRLILDKIPFLIASFYWGGGFGTLSTTLATSHVLSDGGTMTMGTITKYPFVERLVYACAGVIQYIFKLIAPHELALVYPYPVPLGVEMPPEYWFYVVLILVFIIIFGYALFRKIRFLVFGITWFVFAIFPTLHLVIPVTSSIINDRYLYLASIGFYVIFAYGCMLLVEKNQKKLTYTAIGLFIYYTFLAIYSFVQVQVWQNDKTLWTHTVKHHPKAAQGWFGLGNHENKQKNYQRAVDFYDKAIACLPYFAAAYYNRANSLFEIKKYEKALESYNQAIQRNYINSSFYYNRGNTYFRLNRFEDAIQDYDLMLKSDSTNSQGHYNRGMAYLNLNNKPQACVNFEKAAELGYSQGNQSVTSFCQGVSTAQNQTTNEPDYVRYYNQANQFFDQKNYQQALTFYAKSIDNQPIAGAYFNRGNTYYYLGQYQNAIQDYGQAIKLQSTYGEAYFNRGMAKINLQQTTEACSDFEQAQKYNYAPAQAQLEQHCGK